MDIDSRGQLFIYFQPIVPHTTPGGWNEFLTSPWEILEHPNEALYKRYKSIWSHIALHKIEKNIMPLHLIIRVAWIILINYEVIPQDQDDTLKLSLVKKIKWYV